MADINVLLKLKDAAGTVINPATSEKQLPDGHAVNTGLSQPLTNAQLLAAALATEAGQAAIFAKLSSDPATQTTLAAVLAKIISAPATEAKQLPDNHQVAVSNFPATQPVSGTVTANSSAEKAEDAASASGDTGMFVLGVRNTGLATLTNATLDYGAIAVGQFGETLTAPTSVAATYADGSSNTQAVALNHAGNAAINSFGYGFYFNNTTWDRARGTTAGANVVAAASATTTGTTPYSNTALSSTKQAVKSSAGRLHGYHFTNTGTATVYIQFFDLASGSVTVGTTTPTFVLSVLANSTSNGILDAPTIAPPISFGTAITIAATTTPTGSGAPTALNCTLFYI